MRTEQEMFDLILNFARNDERIRVVWMNGSRANPNIIRDKYQDFDIVYAVTEMESFLANDIWLDVFGDRIIMQKPDAMELIPPEKWKSFAYLMLFEDGNRIDLTLVPLEHFQTSLESDRMRALLMDKDGIVPTLPPSTDEDYWLQKPSCKLFDDCCNEFWWVSTYVAKALVRGQIPYANAHLDIIRRELMRMLSWQAGLAFGFSFNIGKDYKYLQKYISKEDWKQLMRTWQMDSSEHIWLSLFEACDLFLKVSPEVAAKLSCSFSQHDHSVMPYLKQIRSVG